MTLPCAQLDEFFDGELSREDADAFRAHLVTCSRCQSALHGRMQEAMVMDEAAPAIGAAPRRLRTRHVVTIAAVLAVAAAAVFALRFRRADSPAPPTIALVIERGDTVVRGSDAHVGDRLHVRATGPIWIYRGDHELLLACPRDPACRPEEQELILRERGTYSFVVLASESAIPIPHGNFDGDVAAAVNAGATYKVETIDVQ